ncbi:MAG: efflux RND transporter permease subunit [Thermoplasmatota archaeon]
MALWSARHARRTTAIITVLTLIVGAGIFQLQTDSDLLKILPKDDPTTQAAQNASTEFRGFYDFVYIYYDIDPAKCTKAQEQLPFTLNQIGCDDVRSEAYVRGMDEFWAFAQREIAFAEYAIDLAAIVKVVNYTNSGVANDDPAGTLQAILDGRTPTPDQPFPPRPEAYALPGTDAVGSLQYEGAWQGANAVDDSINDVIAPTFQAGRTLIFFDSDGLTRVELGQAVYDMVDAYVAQVQACDGGAGCTLQWNVFDVSQGMAVRGVSALDAHASEVTQRDISNLAPWIIFAIVFILYAAFRDSRVLLVSSATLLVAFVWTAGLMGWLNIPFSALNLTIIPLILGVGIDYGIHTVSEYLEHKSEGMSNEDAFHEAGSRAGIAMAIATVTTMCGLMLMVLSPSVLMAQLGIVASLALLDTFLLTMTLIPALLSLTARRSIGRRHQGSATFVQLARWVGRYRGVAVAVLVIVSGAAFVSVQGLEPEPFGNPELNYPEGDRVRDDSQHISDVFFGGNTDTQSNFLVIQGDLTQPEAHQFLDTLEVRMEEDIDIQGFSVTSLTRIVRAWKALEGGTPDAVVNQVLLGNSGNEQLENIEYPTTAAEIKQTFDDIFASPVANLMTILLQEGAYDLGTLTYDTRQELTYEEVGRIWDATWANIWAAQQEVYGTDQRDAAYPGPTAHPFGNNAFSHLFIEEQLPWVNYVASLAFFLVVLMIALLTRDVRATACTAVVMGITSLWWLGLLPMMGVGLSVGLMLPLVFIMAIGSDDAIHLIWNIHRTGDPERVYRFVGKAVTLTTVTTLVAFLIFSFQTDLLVRRTLLATAGAVGIMWLSTVLVVPVFYPVPESNRIRRPARPQTAHVRGEVVEVKA